MTHRANYFAAIVVLAAALALAGGCGKEEANVVAPPPTAVTVSQPVAEQVSDFVEFTGTTDAYASVDIRARVKGFLKKINFEDGTEVKQNDLLFEIEPDVFQGDVDKAKAAVQAAQAQLERAKVDLANKQEMFAGNAATKYEVVVAQATVNSETAGVASANAALEQATINLGYTKIYSPINGRIDRSRVDAGNLVGADGNTLLANIVQKDPIYVYFDVDERTVQRYVSRMIEQGGTGQATEKKSGLPIVMALGDNTDFPFKGTMDYVDNRVDPATGTVKVRGVFQNASRLIAPGFFARVRVPDGEPYKAVMVPDRAIGIDQGQKYLLIVNDKNIVEFRPIETGSQHGRLRVIKKGLNPGEWVIVDGILRTRPGATVSPQRNALPSAEMPSTAPSTEPQI